MYVHKTIFSERTDLVQFSKYKRHTDWNVYNTSHLESPLDVLSGRSIKRSLWNVFYCFQHIVTCFVPCFDAYF